MHEFLLSISAGLLHYLTHSAVMLVVIGIAAWLGDRWLRHVGPHAQHRMWVGALLAAVLLPWLPAGLLSGFGHAGANTDAETATVAYRMIATAVERWTVSPVLCFAAAGAYLLAVLLGVTRLLWKWQRTVAMARRSMVLPLDASACRLFASPRKRQGRWCWACGGYCAVHQFQISRSDRLRVLGLSVEGSQATFDWRRHIRLPLDCVEKILIVGHRHWVELDRLQDRGQRW